MTVVPFGGRYGNGTARVRFRPTAEQVNRHVRRHQLSEVCRNNDTEQACRSLREDGLYEVAELIERLQQRLGQRRLTPSDPVRELERRIAHVVREREHQLRQEQRASLHRGDRDRLIKETIAFFEEEGDLYGPSRIQPTSGYRQVRGRLRAVQDQEVVPELLPIRDGKDGEDSKILQDLERGRRRAP
jgi:hypothetical protein